MSSELDNKVVIQKHVEDDTNIIELNKDELIDNPFFVGVQNNLIKLSSKELYDISNRVLILCIKKNVFKKHKFLKKVFSEGLDISYDLDEKNKLELNHINDNINNIHINSFLEKKINKYIYPFFSNIFTLIEGSKSFIKNKIHLQECILVEKKYLDLFNNNILKLNENELVLLSFLTDDEEIIKQYNSLINKSFDMSKFIEMNILYNKFNNSNFISKKFTSEYGRLKINMISMLEGMRHNNYFSNTHSKKININYEFNRRGFHYRTYLKQELINTEDQKNVLINELSTLKLDKCEDGNYLLNLFRKDLYNEVNISSRSYYRITEPEYKLSKENIISILNYRKTKKDKFRIFNELLLSKDYCHLVLNNKELIKNNDIKDMLLKYKLLYKVWIGYAWLILYLEEQIKKTCVITTDRFVFDLDTACELPLYPYCNDITHCPYLPVPIKKDLYWGKLGLKMGIPLQKNKVYSNKLCNLEQFKKNFNIYTSGTISDNIFDELDWTNKSIGGSSLIACVYLRHPLMDLVSVGEVYNELDNKKRFFNEYWGESDIDLMCYAESKNDYHNQVIEIYNCVKNNLGKIKKIDNIDTDILYIDIHTTSSIIVSKQYIEKYLSYLDFDYIKENLKEDFIKEIFYEIYIVKQMESKRKDLIKLKYKNNSLMRGINKLISMDELRIYIVDDYIEVKNYDKCDNNYIYEKEMDGSYNKNCIIKISCFNKFKIKSHLLERPIEIFRIRFKDPFSCVSRFHLNCVRMYYNGSNLYLLPSCYSALTTFINMDYKYFAGIRDPIEILDKYSSRGFGGIYNDTEKIHMLKYNSSVDKWKRIFNVNLNSKSSMLKHFKPLLLSNEIFKVNKYCKNYPDDIYNNDAYFNNENNYIISKQDLKHYYYNNNSNEVVNLFFKNTTIDLEGNVNPIKPWLAEFIWDYYETNDNSRNGLASSGGRL